MFKKNNSKIIFGSMNIGNFNDSSLNLVSHIQGSGLIVCESLLKFNIFLKEMSINTNAEIVEWDHDILNKIVPDYLLEKENNIKKQIYKNIENNKNVLIVSDEGSSLMLDPGNHFLNLCIDHSIEYEIMPGPSAVIQSFLYNKNFTSDTAEFYFAGWFSNMSNSRKIDFIKKVNTLRCPIIIFLWSRTLLEDINFILNSNINNQSTLCIDLTKMQQFVLTDSLLNIYNKIVSNEIKINDNSLISLVIN